MTGNSDSRLMLLMSVEQCFSIFALFQTASRLSREEFKERLISNILLELLSEPKQELASMKTLDLATCLADGDGALPLLLQTVPLFIEKGVGEQGQAPKAHKRGGTHELILIEAELFLAIGKEDFDVPARRDMRQQSLRRSVQITRAPLPPTGPVQRSG